MQVGWSHRFMANTEDKGSQILLVIVGIINDGGVQMRIDCHACTTSSINAFKFVGINSSRLRHPLAMPMKSRRRPVPLLIRDWDRIALNGRGFEEGLYFFDDMQSAVANSTRRISPASRE